MPSKTVQIIRDFLYSEPVFAAAAATRLHLTEHLSGWITPALAETLHARYPEMVRRHHGEWQLASGGSDYASRSASLQAWAEDLRGHGLVAGWRHEAMVLRDRHGQPYAEMERAALRALGLPTTGVHLNALVQTADGAAMWIAERSASKAVDPGLLDNLVGGGVIGRESTAATLTREAWEEAGLRMPHPGSPRNCLHVRRHSAHGVQDETLYVYERWLNPRFQPENRDGELAATLRLTLPDVLDRLTRQQFTRDAALVILDGCCRQWFFGGDTQAVYEELQAFGLYRHPA